MRYHNIPARQKEPSTITSNMKNQKKTKKNQKQKTKNIILLHIKSCFCLLSNRIVARPGGQQTIHPPDVANHDTYLLNLKSNIYVYIQSMYISTLLFWHLHFDFIFSIPPCTVAGQPTRPPWKVLFFFSDSFLYASTLILTSYYQTRFLTWPGGQQDHWRCFIFVTKPFLVVPFSSCCIVCTRQWKLLGRLL